MKVLKRNDITMVVLQRSILTLYTLSMLLLVEDERSQTRPSGYGLENKGGNPEYLQHQPQGAKHKGAGEIPIIRKGILLARNGEDEEIVESHVKA